MGKNAVYYNEQLNMMQTAKKYSILTQYYQGYWISTKYTDPLKKELQERINFETKYTSQELEIINKQNTVCVHIRKDDYLQNKIFRNLDALYYIKAIRKIQARVKNSFFIFFTEDNNWTIEKICKPLKKELENNYYIMPKGETTHDFMIMKLCKHFIIANSTYSWWAAYLGKTKKSIVIMPKQWLKNESENTAQIYTKTSIKV